MMKATRWMHLAFGLLLAIPAMADDMSLSTIEEAAKRPGDKSRQALVSIFGDIVNNPLAAGGGSDTVLASVFQVTNSALLVIGAFFACYIWARKLTHVAHDGSVFSAREHTLWGPVRILWGIASLVPTANGWALSQLVMLWAASLIGVGVANLGTDAAVAAFQDGKGMIVQPAAPDTIGLSRALFEANLCMHSMNYGLAQAAKSGGFDFENEYVQRIPLENGIILRSKDQGKVCGGAEIDAKLLKPQSTTTNWIGGETLDTSAVYGAHLKALQKMQEALEKEAGKFVIAVASQLAGNGTGDKTTALPDSNQIINRAAQEYETAVNQQAGTKAGALGDLASKLSDHIKAGGWWTLGAWYQTFAHANSKLSNAVAGKAQIYGEGTVGDQGVSALREGVSKFYKTQQANDTSAVALGQTASTSTGDSSRLISAVFQGPGQKLVNYMTSAGMNGDGGGTTNPLIKMKNLGDYTLMTAESAVVLFTGAHVAVSFAKGGSLIARGEEMLTGFGGIAEGALNAITPFFLMIIVPIFLVGAGLSVYLPLVPFIIWFGAIINWLVVVLEAIVAAPLWAITHIDGEGDGMGGRSAHGYIFLLNVTVRPVLMVIGFFGGGAILVVGGTFLNELFGVAVANVQFDSITGLLSMVFLLIVYFGICLSLIHSAFNLVFIVPDQVINWVGGTTSAALGRDSSDNVRNSVNVLMTKLEHMRKPASTPSAKAPGGGENGIKN